MPTRDPPDEPAAPAHGAPPPSDRRDWNRRLRTTAWMLAVWLAATFGVTFFARTLDDATRGWPFSFWMASQGVLLLYLVLVVAYARGMERVDDERAARHAR